MTLTIGIPTYNRKEVLGKLLIKLNASCHSMNYKVLVIDDGSTDGTFDYVSNLDLAPDCFEIITRSNLGYARTFLELLEKCTTEWILVTSDDDDINLGALDELQRVFGLPGFSVVVTDWEHKDGTIARGGQGQRMMVGADLDHTMHAPGISYRPSSLVEPMQKLKLFLETNSEAAFFYPQVLICAYSVAARGAIFSPTTVVKEIDEYPSGLISTSGKNYWHPQSRISQYISYIDIYLDLKSSSYIDSEKIAKTRLRINRLKYLHSTEEIFSSEISVNNFRKQAILFYSRRYISSILGIGKMHVLFRYFKSLYRLSLKSKKIS